MEELKRIKAQCLGDLITWLPKVQRTLTDIDPRLYDYVADAISNDGQHANIYELLGIRKVFRLIKAYELTPERVKLSLRAIEGQWKNGKHVRGGLKFTTPRGQQHVRLMPYQVWTVFGIYAFTTEVDMEREYHEGDQLLPSEFVKDGRVCDKRRLTAEVDLFQTRKSGKTEFGAALDFTDVCFLGPNNGQCLIAANTREQAKIAYKAIKNFAMQIDPTCLNRMGGKYFRLTATEMNWQPGHKMQGEIKTLAAGGKISKDGLYASWVHADEHGSARYVAGRSDMQELVNVCAGSMGPRREQMLLHTTTAGLVNEGPYKNQLEQVEKRLLEEINYPLGEPIKTPNDDRFSLLFRLDPWEVNYDLDQLDDPELFKKVNRSIGTTVQPTWYHKRLKEARDDADVRKEVLTKDFNVWLDGRVVHWLTGDRIRPLQISKRITDCKFDDGWRVFCGLDFSHGDDLFALTYLGVNYKPTPTPEGHMFADMDAWILEEALKKSPNRPLYEQWIEQGWLHVCPGEVFDSILAMNVLAQLVQDGVDIMYFGYDPAQNRSPINQLKAWLQTLFQARQAIGAREMQQVIDRMVVAVSQSAMTMNPLIGHIEDLIKDNDRTLLFSDNPMWPWQFGNCSCEMGNSNLRRIIKGGPIATHKIDNVMALLDALWCFDLSEGQVGQ